MNTVFSPSSLRPLPISLHNPTRPNLRPRYRCSYLDRSLSIQSPLSSTPHSLHNSKLSINCVDPLDKGVVSMISYEDVMEKDWSFLETDFTNLMEVHKQNNKRIINVGEIEDTSNVLVSIGSEEFVDQLVASSSPSQELVIVHESLFVLAGIKEKYDEVNCWQGELINVPQKWSPFDVVFLYFLPALPFELGEIFGALAQRCSPGARIVISHPQGRAVVEQQRSQYPEVVISSLPDMITLRSVASGLSFHLADFVDEAGFYLAVLKFVP